MKNLVKTGSCGTCIWSLDEKGTLTIAPEKGESGVLGEEDFWPWQECAQAITEITVKNVVYAAKDAGGMFADLAHLQTADISGLDLENTENITGLFERCEKLEKVIGLGGLNTPNLKTADRVFAYCLSLPHAVGIEHWDIGNLESVKEMFRFCVSLTEVDLSDWEQGAKLDMEGAFSECWSLTHVDLGTWGKPEEKGFAEHIPGKKAEARKEYASIPAETNPEAVVTLDLVKYLREDKAHVELAYRVRAKRAHVVPLTLADAKELYAELGRLLADKDTLETLED